MLINADSLLLLLILPTVLRIIYDFFIDYADGSMHCSAGLNPLFDFKTSFKKLLWLRFYCN